MAVYDILPEEELNDADVMDSINAYGGKVDKIMECFVAENIDMWSKFKPVISPELIIPLEIWKAEGYRGLNGDCGLNIMTKGTMEALRPYLENGEALWTYNAPKGGETEPMRFDDFRLYNPRAVNPIGELTTDGYSKNGSATVEGNVTFSVDVLSGMEYNLNFEDIRIGGTNGTPLTSFYLGIYAWKDNAWKYRTNNVPLGQNYNFTVDIPLTTGEWKITPFFSSVPQTGTGTAGVLLGANLQTKVFSIISTNEKVEFRVHGTWDSKKTKVKDIYVFVKNNTGSVVTLKNIGVSLRGVVASGVDYGVGNPDTVYYKGSAVNTLSVPANTDVVTEPGDFGDITLVDARPSYEYQLRGSGYVGDTLYSDMNGIEEEITEMKL